MRPGWAALGAALLASAALAAAATPDAGLTAGLQADASRYLAARAAIEHVSAVSVSVSLPGVPQPIDVTAGTTTFGGATPATAASLFQVGAQTMSFTAAVLLQLESEGRLRLDQPLGDFLPQYRAWSGVSIRSLLNMTSGIPDYLDDAKFLAAVAADPGHVWTVPQLIAFAAMAPPAQSPWHYSNTGYLLAQLIIERITGAPLQTAFQQRLLGPRFGLADTFYSPDRYPASVNNLMAAGTFFDRSSGDETLVPLLGRDVKEIGMSMFQGAGGMVSRPHDMTLWLRALYQGHVLPQRQRDELMQTVSERTGKLAPRPTRTDTTVFGLGVELFRWPLAGLGWNYFGETLGYRCFTAWFPRSDIAIAISLNSRPSADDEYALRGLFQSVILSLHKAGKL